MVVKKITERLARNFSNPEKSIFGLIAMKFMLKNNSFLETNAVSLCKIQPDHNVLEIGFGAGVGLQAAYNILKDGKGMLYGIDKSFYSVERSSKRLKQGIAEKKVVLFDGSADNIPLNTDTIHRVYHCNCYYFWPNNRTVMREIYRVMRPGALMITTLNLDSLRKAESKGLLMYGDTDPVKYMACLEMYGFENVRMEYHKDASSGTEFQVIFSEITEKPAHDKPILSDDEDDALEREELKKMIQMEREAAVESQKQ